MREARTCSSSLRNHVGFCRTSSAMSNMVCEHPVAAARSVLHTERLPISASCCTSPSSEKEILMKSSERLLSTPAKRRPLNRDARL
eukprot:scaffold39667_cov112-Isochrysis_galbana.AAC.2